MKANISAIALSLFLCSFALGRDSLWGLGDNGKIAISFLEHRSTNGTDRAVDVTLIMGAWVLVGTLEEPSDSDTIVNQPIALSTKNGHFKGTISIDWSDNKHQLKLTGQLILQGNAFKLNETIQYKVMTGL